jgi:radical SAM protein with 4Fe4S-binding SPASM domain
MKHRYEKFGGIVASDDPPFLAFVDRQFMRELGLPESPLWQDGAETVGVLSAPTEVHFAATNACPVGCSHCYMDAGLREAAEMDTAAFKQALTQLAEIGVFHIALGGGEALARPDLFELAAHTRALGMVPNLTISGALMNAALAERMTVFGQVNVSLDGAEDHYGVFRDPSGIAAADRAIDLLTAADVPTGINCVLGRRNFGGIPRLFTYAAQKKVNEIEFLRLKPTGRAAATFVTERTTYAQNIALTPLLAHLADEHGVTAKIDCSFVPMLCEHDPPIGYLEETATYGCEAGNVLLGVRSDGRVSGCSFLPGMDLFLADLPRAWERSTQLARLRSWCERALEPCRSCAYLSVCKGGCRAVAARVTGEADAPDPDCPRVVRARAQGASHGAR